MTADLSDPAANRLLATLPRADLAQLKRALKLVSLAQGVVLHHARDDVAQVYFPHTGMVSLMAVMKDGRAIETATVGCEGVVAPMAGLVPHRAHSRAVVQLPLTASQISAVTLRKAVVASHALRSLIVHANDALLAQVQITAACNALHPIEARLARWILQSSDRTSATAIPLTQELLSQMLGVTRSSVSDVACKLQSGGLIRYSRGAIQIIDRKALAAVSCECYDTVVETTADILPPAASRQLAS